MKDITVLRRNDAILDFHIGQIYFCAGKSHGTLPPNWYIRNWPRDPTGYRVFRSKKASKSIEDIGTNNETILCDSHFIHHYICYCDQSVSLQTVFTKGKFISLVMECPGGR